MPTPDSSSTKEHACAPVLACNPLRVCHRSITGLNFGFVGALRCCVARAKERRKPLASPARPGCRNSALILTPALQLPTGHCHGWGLEVMYSRNRPWRSYTTASWAVIFVSRIRKHRLVVSGKAGARQCQHHLFAVSLAFVPPAIYAEDLKMARTLLKHFDGRLVRQTRP